jgi:hypothetical protein
MKIDEQLYLTIPVDRPDGTTIHVHAASIGREVFQRYWLTMAQAFNEIFQKQLFFTGPRVAAMMLRSKAEADGIWDGPMGVEAGLMGEIRRLANVVVPAEGRGWTPIPYMDAVRDGVIDQEDAEEIDGLLSFFTLVSRLHVRADRARMVRSVAAMWDASTSSLSLSAYANSLATSTVTASTGVTPQAPSLPPSSTGAQALGSKNASGNGAMAPSPGAPLMNTVNAI